MCRYLNLDFDAWVIPLPEEEFSMNEHMQCPAVTQEQVRAQGLGIVRLLRHSVIAMVQSYTENGQHPSAWGHLCILLAECLLALKLWICRISCSAPLMAFGSGIAAACSTAIKTVCPSTSAMRRGPIGTSAHLTTII